MKRILSMVIAGIVAGVLFVLPSVFILWALSYIYVTCGNVAWVSAIFYGLKPAVLAIVAAAVRRIGQRALKNEVMWSIAALAFAGGWVGLGVSALQTDGLGRLSTDGVA